MAFPEGLQDGRAVDLAWVEHNQDSLIMTRHPCADLAVGRVWSDARLVAYRSEVDAIELPELALGSPKTSHPDVETLKALGVGGAEVAVENGVGELDWHWGVAPTQGSRGRWQFG